MLEGAEPDRCRVVRRPPGSSSTAAAPARGYAADLAARLVAGADRFAIDCGGDMRVGGRGAHQRPFDVQVRHPLTGETAPTALEAEVLARMALLAGPSGTASA